MKTCDLHTHSVYSDGTWTPVQLVEEAQQLGLGAIALTDHNTVAGLPEFLSAAEGRGVEAVPGIEFSTDYRDLDVHILGLFIQPEHYKTITDLLADVQRRKDESNRELAENLARAGFVFDYDALKAKTPDGSINRAHIATELVHLGYVSTTREAFQRLLGRNGGYYHPPKRMSSFECIRCIRELGAVSVLAHPLLTMTPAGAREFLEQAQGLDAMETRYVTYDGETTRIAREMAAAFSLLESGGSDFHADNKPGIYLGTGTGTLSVPLQLLEGLRERYLTR